MSRRPALPASLHGPALAYAVEHGTEAAAAHYGMKPAALCAALRRHGYTVLRARAGERDAVVLPAVFARQADALAEVLRRWAALPSDAAELLAAVDGAAERLRAVVLMRHSPDLHAAPGRAMALGGVQPSRGGDRGDVPVQSADVSSHKLPAAAGGVAHFGGEAT